MLSHKSQNLNPPRITELFWDNQGQVVRIPADFELPGDSVAIHREGDRLILEPISRNNLLYLLARMDVLGPEDQFPEVGGTWLS